MSLLRPPSKFSVTRGVHGFRSVMVNFFLVQASDEGEWVIVDAGLRGGGPRLTREAAWRFGGRTPPAAILLTHGHFDHIGALPWLIAHWPDCPIYAHDRELPFLNDRMSYPPPDPSVGGGIMGLSSPFYPRRPPDLKSRVQALPADGSVPGLEGWQWIETPGHSPGHVSFWRERDRTLIAGDAVVTTRQESALAVLTQRPEVRPPPAYFTPNWRLAYESLEKIRSLRPEILATGHGRPLQGPEMRAGLDLLVNEFESRGLPEHGHYVRSTWLRA